MSRPGLERLGPYNLIRNLTRPGRAEVYVGELAPRSEPKAKEQLSKLPEVAIIKVLRPPEQVDPGNMPRVQEAMARFVEEGRLGTRLRHPSITRTYGVALDNRQNQHFIIQEFVEGATLAQVLDYCAGREQKLPFSTVLRMVVPVLKALHYAHHDALREDGRPLRVVHRDIKPANVMLTWDGRIVLLDLASARSTSFTRQATVQDVVMGTSHYLAPEQVFDTEQVGHQTDIFATGVILYELASLTPLLPRTRKLSEIATALANFKFSNHASYIDEAVYPGLAAVLNRALAAKPTDRYTTTGEMARDLEGLLLKAGDGTGLAPFVQELRRQWEGASDEEEARSPRSRATLAPTPSSPGLPPVTPVTAPTAAPVTAAAASASASLAATPAERPKELDKAPAPVEPPVPEVEKAPLTPAANPLLQLNNTGVMRLPSSDQPAPPQPSRNWRELVIAALLGMIVMALIYLLLGGKN